MTKFKKADLVERIAETEELSLAEAERRLNSTINGLEVMLSEMKPEDKLQLVGFLTFEVKHKEAHTAQNPRTGDPVRVEASNKLKVKAGKSFIKAVQ